MMRNFVILFLLINITILAPASAQKKWVKNFGIDFQLATLTNIEHKDHLESFKSNTAILPSPYFLIGKEFGKAITLHTGAQYQYMSNTTNANYVYSTTENFRNTLDIRYHYIVLPILLDYKVWKHNKNSVRVGLGILNKFPVHTNLTYDGAWTHRGTDGPNLAPQFTMDGKISLLYQYQLKSNKSFGINVFAANGFINIFDKIYTGPGSPHYSNSKMFYYGMGLSFQL